MSKFTYTLGKQAADNSGMSVPKTTGPTIPGKSMPHNLMASRNSTQTTIPAQTMPTLPTGAGFTAGETMRNIGQSTGITNAMSGAAQGIGNVYNKAKAGIGSMVGSAMAPIHEMGNQMRSNYGAMKDLGQTAATLAPDYLKGENGTQQSLNKL